MATSPTRRTNYQYEELLEDIHISEGTHRMDRTGVGTKAIFSTNLKYDLFENYDHYEDELSVDIPLLATKSVPFKSVLAELLWFLSGSTNNNDLNALGSTIWDEWAEEDGSLGKIYGYQWRNWDGQVDQLKNLITGLINDPTSRRHIITAWNPTDIENGEVALPPCHMTMQFFVGRTHAGRSRLSLKVYQRSADMFLGVPFNIASYTTLLAMVSIAVGMIPDKFVWTGGDTHIYDNHIPQVTELLSRYKQLIRKDTFLRSNEGADVPNEDTYVQNLLQPRLVISNAARGSEKPTPEDALQRLLAMTMDDFSIEHYHPFPAIPAPVAV